MRSSGGKGRKVMLMEQAELAKRFAAWGGVFDTGPTERKNVLEVVLMMHLLQTVRTPWSALEC
jgi:hypothetical protein